jgi:UDP-GlcNAc3NAcA epimerase
MCNIINIFIHYRMKILSLVGTRPQFLKLAPLSKKMNEHKLEHIIVHSGQHYDKEMSEDLFKVLDISEPKYILKKEGSTCIQNLGNMMNKIEEICLIETPDKIIVFGDCDTTIAGALVAKKLKIYLVHIESGMRSYNKDMPEEINRLMTDHISDLLLCSTKDSVEKLKNENITKNVYFVGNLQLELLKNVCDTYNDNSIITEHKLERNNFALMTIHREYNTNKEMLNKIFLELEKINIDIVFPIHPRTRNIIVNNNIIIPKNLKLIKPVDYLNMTIFERNCKFIITDSGGVQPEAWYLGKKCIIMRSETEWIEPLKNNNNILYDYKTPLNNFIDDFLKVEIEKCDIDCSVSENIYLHL